jgi:hypothetical protein
VDVEEPADGLNCELWIQRDRNGSERYLFIMVKVMECLGAS